MAIFLIFYFYKIGHTEIVRFLIEKGAKSLQNKNGQFPVDIAVEMGWKLKLKFVAMERS